MKRFRILFGFSLFISCAFGQKQEGLVANFSFNNGSVKNEVGNEKVKEYGTKRSEDRFGNKKFARYFQGNKDSYINLGTSDLLKPKVGTISLWVQIEQAVYKGEGFHCNPIIHTRSRLQDDFNEGYAIMYQYNTRKLHCNISDSELNPVTLYPVEVSYFEKWYHLVMTYDNKNLKFYVDGVLEAQAEKNFENQFLDGDSVVLGVRWGHNNKRYFQGIIDDILIYNRVLDAKEVLSLYNAPDPEKKAAVIKWSMYSLLILLFFILLFFIVKWRIRKALSKEKEKNQLRNNWYEQENKVLTAQMDPHFIFNSLNAIQQFIILNDNDKAQLYLTKFSRLLRMILESNLKDNISLTEEISIIEHYLEIESLRFNNVFKHELFIEKTIEPEHYYIPRYLIQPFIENAIWHGLLPKDGDKQLNISFEYAGEKMLCCIIEDNGVGRNFQSESSKDDTKKSLAINFINQRLQLMSKIYKEEYSLTITDKTNNEGKSAGTKVTIIIPLFKN